MPYSMHLAHLALVQTNRAATHSLTRAPKERKESACRLSGTVNPVREAICCAAAWCWRPESDAPSPNLQLEAVPRVSCLSGYFVPCTEFEKTQPAMYDGVTLYPALGAARELLSSDRRLELLCPLLGSMTIFSSYEHRPSTALPCPSLPSTDRFNYKLYSSKRLVTGELVLTIFQSSETDSRSLASPYPCPCVASPHRVYQCSLSTPSVTVKPHHTKCPCVACQVSLCSLSTPAFVSTQSVPV
ncbi:hypothetical protein RRG08_037272 [Elysia crispata]|uniref:Uncharacterized protein n=1 Tax=Elysia crispata TaxID=231223 RepID=A0AAE1CPB9_9GAST|nr:hypothetical protein RRG08_037272 [Elysia crispata]